MPRTGRRPCLSQPQIAQIEQWVLANPFTTTQKIKEQFGLECSNVTIKRQLNKIGFRCRCPARKIELTNEHAENRVRFARQNAGRDWQNVIFSDEKVFSTSDDSPKVLWRRNLTRYQPEHVQLTRRSGRISCAFWGWMCAAGPGELVPIPQRFTSGDYVTILEDILLPSVRTFFPDGPIYFVQDNSPIHTANIVRNWFAMHEEINVIPWPARSADLNPIENLWGLMVRNWSDDANRNVRNVDHLTRNVTAVWDRLRGRDYCENLVNSMHERLQKCLQSNGFYTKY